MEITDTNKKISDEIAEELALLDIEVGYISASDFTDEKKNYLASFLNNGDFSRLKNYVQGEFEMDDLNSSLHKRRFNNILKGLDALEKNSIFYKLGSLQYPLNYKTEALEKNEGKENKVSLNDFLLYYEEGKDLVGDNGELNTHLKDINEALEKSNLKPIYFYTGSRREKEFINTDISFSDFAKLNSEEYVSQKKQKSHEEEM